MTWKMKLAVKTQLARYLLIWLVNHQNQATGYEKDYEKEEA